MLIHQGVYIFSELNLLCRNILSYCVLTFIFISII